MRFPKILLGTLIAVASAGAFAQTAQLKVIGSITPSACTPVFTGGDTIDLGKISASTLSTTDFTYVGHGTSSLTITCDAPTRVAVTTADDRRAAGTPTGIAAFIAAAAGLPVVPLDNQISNFALVGTNQVGGYQLRLPPGAATGDGNAVDSIISSNGGPWALGSGLPSQLNVRRHSWATPDTLVPTAHTVIVQPITVDAAINKVVNLPALTNEVPLDGQMTISIVYL